MAIGGNGELLIGNNVGISNSYISAYNNIQIEDNVMIGACCKIMDTDFHPVNYTERVVYNGLAKTAPILIKEGAFIGACSIITKGVTIGEHAVIGAGSVVTCDIPKDEVWGGNHARFIKKLGG